jgi:GGDEF domain-containing protein
LKRILQDDGASEETLLRIVRLLLQGIGQRAIEGDPDDLGAFRIGVQRLVSSLEGNLTASDLLLLAGSALQLLDDYNRRTARHLKRASGEWQAVATMLISALAGTLAAGEERASHLRGISARVRSANGVDDVHKIRLELSDCLTQLQLENRRGKEENRATALPLTAADSGPGLSYRPEAEEALARASQTDPPSYVAVMALDRIPVFNMRFGHQVGEEVMRFYGESLRTRLRASDRVFQWSDTALLALLPRPNRLEIVRDEIARLMEVRCEHTVQTASRTILLPIAARWTVFPSMAAPRLLILKIDGFTEMKAAEKA